MSRYIPYDKMKSLREAAKNGDEMAKKILRAQLSDDEDFSCDLEEFFKPKEEPKPIEEVATEPAEKQPETEQVQEMVKQPSVLTGQIPENDISQGILALISSCDKKTIEIANNNDITEATKKGALSILGEIKQSCLDNLEKFGKLMVSLKTKEEKEVEELE